MEARIPPDEAERLQALARYNILDTAPEQAFDDLTRMAAQVCGTPIALVSMVDARRQWFKSRVGLSIDATPRDAAFCAHAILDPDDVLIVTDAQQDARFADNPLVRGEPKIRFYAGAPLVTADGRALGTLCVIDRVPRTLSAEQLEALRALRRSVMLALDWRQTVARLQRTVAQQQQTGDDLAAQVAGAQEALRALQDAGRLLVGDLDFDRAAGRILVALLELFRARRATLHELDPATGLLTCVAAAGDGTPRAWIGHTVAVGRGLSGRAVQERRTLWSTDLLADPTVSVSAVAAERILGPDCRAWASIPLVASGEVLGALSVGDTTGRTFGEDEIELLSAFASHAAIAIGNARLYGRLREGSERLHALSRRLMEVQEAERRHLARELHDEIGQSLTAATINLRLCRDGLADATQGARLDETLAILDGVLGQVRDLSLDLRPAILDEVGLAAALRWYVDRQAQRAGFTGRLAVGPLEGRVAPDVETACFRVVQEAMTNVVRHAGAGEVRVELSQEDGALALTVADDGHGFDVGAARSRGARGAHLGLIGMEERVQLLDGRFEIESAPGQGTIIRARFPLAPPADAP